VFKETGLSIVCVSAAVSISCLPLYMVAEKWQKTERDIQKRLAPKIAKIKTFSKGDEQYMLLSAYYRQNHYHPVYALRSSVGLLIQIPFFIAAYSYLSHLELLKGSSFLFIADLGKPDKLLPIIGGINLLPVLMTLINITAGAVYARGFGLRDKVQLYGMAIVFLVLLYNSPSGLVLYWTLNNIFSLFKNIYIKIKYHGKHLILFAIISFCCFIFSYHTIFSLHGAIRVRNLIAVLSIIIGIFPWIALLFLKQKNKINYISPWTQKETLFLYVSSLLVIFTAAGVFIPSMLIASSPQEFSFIDTITSPLYFIYLTFIQAFGLFLLWPSVIYFLFSENVKKIFSIFAVVFSFSVLFNIFLFPGNYGPISKEMVFSGNATHNLKEIILNFSILTLVSLIILFIYLKGVKKILLFSNTTLFASLLLFSTINIFKISGEFNKLSSYYIPETIDEETLNPIFSFSKSGKNVIVIMLDMAQSSFIPYIFEESPELNQSFSGFVYYPNTVSFNGWTRGGAPPIFGGYEYTPKGINNRPDISLSRKFNEALLLLPRLFSTASFSAAITDPPYADDNWIPNLEIFNDEINISSYITDGVYTDIWLNRNNIILPPNSEVLKRNILWYSIFRQFPLAFRQGIYFKGSWCAPYSNFRMRMFINGYSVLDLLPELTNIADSNENFAILMTNNTTHENLFLQAPSYTPQFVVTNYGSGRFCKEDWYHVNASAIKRLSDFFNFLKLNDIYDNTRIIIVSDHARLESSYVTRTSLPFHLEQFNSVLLFKDFNEKGNLRTDMSFMSTADVPSLAIEGILENPINPFTGNSVTAGAKKDPLLILIRRLENKNENEILITPHNSYYVQENIFDEKNWVKPQNSP
jgi:YidC/Oxa1 family membrane protein insertase